MKTKHALYLLLAMSLTATGVAVAQQTAPATPELANPDEPMTRSFSILLDGGGFLGVNTEDITKENMSHYGLREARGVGITGVTKDSPAEKAGLRTDDVILRVDSETVTSARKLSRLISEVAPDHTVRLTIARGGTEQEVAVTIGKRDEARTIRDLFKNGAGGMFKGNPQIWKWEGTPGFDGSVFSFGSSRRIGISTMQLTKQLADYFGIADGQGVLVTSVTEDGPAAKGGLRAGDVITAVDGEKVDSSGDISRAISKKKDGDVTLTIVRNKTQQTIRVTPKENPTPYVVPGGTQMGRTIVIPRIDLPNIPEINISMPGIELPVIPQINIQLPKIVKPVKVKNVGTI
ncbi:MAG TPA: PDZ domain-containing protein [Pyrinomonadaceae bacterium]